MGKSENNSLVNFDCQVWDVPNILITDGVLWPTTEWSSPILTMIVITARACSNIVGSNL